MKVIINFFCILVIFLLFFFTINTIEAKILTIGETALDGNIGRQGVFYSSSPSKGTYWETTRTAYWSDTRVALWSTPRNTEIP